jgi:hypothetical protein
MYSIDVAQQKSHFCSINPSKEIQKIYGTQINDFVSSLQTSIETILAPSPGRNWAAYARGILGTVSVNRRFSHERK